MHTRRVREDGERARLNWLLVHSADYQETVVVRAILRSIMVVVLGSVMSTAFAEVVNVGGVIWDTDYELNFTSTPGNAAQSFSTSQVNGLTALSGYGRIDFLNFNSVYGFCPTCELTFVFGGYVSNSPGFDLANRGMLAFGGGWLNVYVDAQPNFWIEDGETAADGLLWLSLTGAELSNTSLTLSRVEGGTDSSGLLRVAGGLAAEYFDTNTFPDGADFKLQAGFTAASNSTRGGVYFGPNGNVPSAVPEPSTVGLLLAGLAGLCFTRDLRRAG